MKTDLRIGLAQINCTVGDLKGNTQKIHRFIEESRSMGVDLVTFPELAIIGYPPEDLLLKPKFIEDNLEKLKELMKSVNDIAVVVGFVDREKEDIYNAAAIIYEGEIKGIYYKMILPNYGVFDEKRYFKPGIDPLVFKFGRFVLGVNICEDIWDKDGPTRSQAKSGAKIILNINASPYHAGKIKIREEIVCNQAKDNRVFFAYTNLVGGQDELIFDGQSMVVDSNGKLIARAEAFAEDLLIVDLDIPTSRIKPTKRAIMIIDEVAPKSRASLTRKETKKINPLAEIYQALTLGVKDYVTKNGFQKVAIGLSGGIDSALTAAIAVDSLGSENVVSVFMPSQYSSWESKEDAQKLAMNSKIQLKTIPIQNTFNVYQEMLSKQFKDHPPDVTEENIQARIRGNILMALSNKFGWLVLTTGNKSEMSVGYATLYGDMAGGFAVIKDVPKTLVYKLAKYRNSIGDEPVIPERVLRKEPSAELKPDQKDKDSLPPYEVLDPILEAYIEKDKSFQEIIRMGYEKELVARIVALVDRNEYKRRQAPPGIKITPKAFGKDRRIPITNKFSA
jgi:NAD+ synthase (glutamine-hydrolysing)